MNLPRPAAAPLRNLALSLIVSLMAGTAPASAADKPDTARMDAQYHIMLGEMAAGRQQPSVAAHEFLQALETVNDVDLAKRATENAMAAREVDTALQAARKWLALDPSSMDAREVIARMSLIEGNLAETTTQCEAIVSGAAGGPSDGMMLAARLLGMAYNSQADGALAVMNQLVAKRPQLPAAQHAMSLLALRFNRIELADAAAREAVRLAPKDKDQHMLLTGVLVKQGKLDEADREFEALVKGDSKATDLRMGYAKLLLESDQREAARTQLLRVIKDKPDYADAHFALGVLAFNDRNYAEAEQHFKRLLDGKRAADAAYQLGRIAEVRKNYAQALNYYEQADGGGSALDAAVRHAYVLAAMHKIDEAQDLMAQLREELPQYQQRFYLAEGDLLLNAGEPDRAIKVYGEALKQTPDDADLLYGRSLVYERTARIELAEKDLRAILAKDPNDSRAMNALGYMLTVHTRRYDEASQLISRALQLTPDDAAVIDSMGWVQFKLGHTGEARALLQKAYDRFPDPEVAAHLGEVMWAMGDKDQARALLERTVRDAPDATAPQETLQRLTH
ncbi:MAG: tetratricopeptide repeat protein [Nevskiaceae bacterium]|nr:MAG: tetratricopeptide repeat protein [Nevskiaceae bacterium]